MSEGSRYRLPKGFAVINDALFGVSLTYSGETGHIDRSAALAQPDDHLQTSTQPSEGRDLVKQSSDIKLNHLGRGNFTI